MSKRQRHAHNTDHDRQAARAVKRQAVLLSVVVLAVVLTLVCVAGLLVQSPWMVAHRTQIIGLIGLALLAVLFSLPIVVEFNRHPRHLSGPGRNPEQGWRP